MTPAWRPGDRRADVASMLRVDQAGEYGATRIYAGQLAVLGDRHKSSALIAGTLSSAPMSVTSEQRGRPVDIGETAASRNLLTVPASTARP